MCGVVAAVALSIDASGGQGPGLAELATVSTALLAAAVTALGTALQQRGAQSLPSEGRADGPGVLAWVRSRMWLLGVAVTLSGFGIYLLALAHGALVLAQPVMIMGMVLGPMFAAWLARRRADRQLLFGGALCALGLGLVLVAAHPDGTTRPLGAGPIWWLVVTFGVLLVPAVGLAIGGRGLPRALATALVAGVLYGTNAALAKLVLEQLRYGVGEPLRHVGCYLMVVAAPTGFLISQRAMRLSRVLAPVLAVMGAADPMTAVAIGVVAYGEQISTAAGALVGQGVGAAAVLAGIAVVSRRSARLVEADRAARSVGGHADGALSWG